MAKLLYESIESIDPGPLEAMTAVGANKVQWIIYGVIPQVKAHFVSYVLYTFEVNVRAAAVLGLVGAGGIGLYYDRTLGFLQYEQTASIIIYTLVVVLLIDYVSTLFAGEIIMSKNDVNRTKTEETEYVSLDYFHSTYICLCMGFFGSTARRNQRYGGRNYKSNYDRCIESRLVVCIFVRW